MTMNINNLFLKPYNLLISMVIFLNVTKPTVSFCFMAMH